MKRFLPWIVLIVAAAGICWRFPLFHVVPLGQAEQVRAAAVFNAADFAETFWKDKLLKALDQAVKLEVLLPAIRSDPAMARRQYGRSLGISESYTYFVRGQGRVLAANEEEIALVVTEAATEPEVTLQTGLLFSSTVRDGTGLLNVSDYPNSQDFNAISEALNRIIEERVQPTLREQARVGAVVTFVGCAEVNDETADLKPLKVVPIQAEVR